MVVAQDSVPDKTYFEMDLNTGECRDIAFSWNLPFLGPFLCDCSIKSLKHKLSPHSISDQL